MVEYMEHYIRLKKIAEYVQEKKRVTTSELAKKFDVSNQTIRKDLQVLEDEKKVKRIHGGAKYASTFRDRLDIDVENKKLLCRRAATYIEDGDYIYIDGGTSYYYLMDFVPKALRVTVVTSSIPIAERIKNNSNHDVYLLGGLINSTTMETYSANTLREISSMMFNKSFMGVTGFVENVGFTEENVYSLEVKEVVKDNTTLNIVVAGKEKEGIVSFRKSFEFKEIDVLVTNANISESLLRKISHELEVNMV